MKIKKKYEDAGIIVFQDTFSKTELESIKHELFQLYSNNMFLEPDLTGGALDEDGKHKKNNVALCLDVFYTDGGRQISPILNYLSKHLLSTEIKEIYSEINPICSIIKNVNAHATIVNYYENEGRYDYHADDAAFTTLTYVYEDNPKRFSGGDISFKVNNEEIFIEIESNMSIIFPSSYEHKVSKVLMDDSDKNKMLGRFSLSQFLGIRVY